MAKTKKHDVASHHSHVTITPEMIAAAASPINAALQVWLPKYSMSDSVIEAALQNAMIVGGYIEDPQLIEDENAVDAPEGGPGDDVPVAEPSVPSETP